jgi:biotin carboxyl carrier protein
MAEILRRTELRGDDLQTNLSVHYGLIQWFLGKGVMAEPTTRFMTAYLAAVGALQQLVLDTDVELVLRELLSRATHPEQREALAAKQTLLQRPIERLLADPHILGGFLGRHDGEFWDARGDEVRFVANPVHFLDGLYHFLDLEPRPGSPPIEQIWEHDAEILTDSLEFYREVEQRTGASAYDEVEALFSGAEDERLSRGDTGLWQRCVAAHRGFQAGLEALLLIPRIGVASEFLSMTVTEELQPVFPEKFTEAESVTECTRALSPPPPSASDEIVTPMGGSFYAREAPDLPPLISVGDHFEAGQPLFVVEVMKMFNKVAAPFAGTIVECRMEGRDGSVVKKGDVIFRIEPDEQPEIVSDEEIAARRRRRTLELLGV